MSNDAARNIYRYRVVDMRRLDVTRRDAVARTVEVAVPVNASVGAVVRQAVGSGAVLENVGGVVAIA